jgi:SAM-dependent methyltransferase
LRPGEDWKMREETLLRSGNADAYGQELWACYRNGEGYEIIERDDGLITVSSAAVYFSEYKDWPPSQKKAANLARGRVLDVGCGPGRVALYLQERGCDVTPIDNSPLAVRISRERGLDKAMLRPFEQIHRFPADSFDTVVFFGNNLGLLGSRTQGRRLLRQLHRITSPAARIIGESRDPYRTRDPLHRRYHRRNRARNRMAGRLRIRVRHQAAIGAWFDYLLLSRNQLKDLLRGTGWKVERFIEEGFLYFAVMVKTSR